MIDDPDVLAKRIAYIDTIRGMHRNKRLVGFIGCLVGVVVMLLGRFRPEVPGWTIWAGLTIVIVSWVLFAFVIFTRTMWVRTHPFDPQAQ